MLTTTAIFDRYQQVRPRFPQARMADRTQDIASLTEIAEPGKAFVFDAFGVLNVGETMIEGADLRLNQLRAMGCAIRILTNSASYNRAGAIAKFGKLGIEVADSEIITSRDATLDHLEDCVWGIIAAAEDRLTDIGRPCLRLADDPADFDRVEGFLFLSSYDWTEARQKILETSLHSRPRPVLVANADIAAPRDTGFSLEPGHYGHLIADRGQNNVRFFGKPFPEVYALVEKSLPDLRPDQIVMCGDTLHTDILGAAARGWQTVLVTRDGMFAGHDAADFCTRAGLHPDWRLPRI